MTKIRTFFGLGRKPKKKSGQNNGIELPDNFIMGSTNQKTAREKISESKKSD